jgi:hypothetical protein
MAWYMLKPPVPCFQDTDSHCWAAGASSWLRTTHIGDASLQTIIARYKDYCDSDGYLVEGENEAGVARKGGIKAVFYGLGVYLISRPRADFTYDLAKTILTKKGHFLLIGTKSEATGDAPAHTRVVYGVGVYNEDFFSAFNPFRNAELRPEGYENLPFDEFNGSDGNLYLGWPRWAGPNL